MAAGAVGLLIFVISMGLTYLEYGEIMDMLRNR